MGLASTKDGSDADFEFVCTPCGYDDIREEAVKYCPECEEYLCTKCINEHDRLTLTSHKLLDRDADKQVSVALKTTKCRYHPDQDIEMYCGAHDMVYCTKCIATEHRSCAGVTGIEDIQTTPDKQREVQSLKDDTRNIQERLKAIDEKTQNNMDIIDAPRQYKVKSRQTINVKMQNDEQTCYICDICQLPDGTIILADHSNKKIKRLDENYKVKDHCDIDDYLRGICCTGQNEVAVKISSNKVQFILVGSSLSKIREISVTGGGFWGIAYCARELWILERNIIRVYNTSGSLMKTISKDANARDIFGYKSDIQRIAVCGDTVIVADYRDGAVCLGKDGTVKRQLRNGKLAHTMGVCVSNDGTLFVSGLSTENIVMFDKDGEFLGELVAKGPGLAFPLSLCYDDKTNRMFVTRASSNNIICFDIHNVGN